jgi:hypothetical protein
MLGDLRMCLPSAMKLTARMMAINTNNRPVKQRTAEKAQFPRLETLCLPRQICPLKKALASVESPNNKSAAAKIQKINNGQANPTRREICIWMGSWILRVGTGFVESHPSHLMGGIPGISTKSVGVSFMLRIGLLLVLGVRHSRRVLWPQIVTKWLDGTTIMDRDGNVMSREELARQGPETGELRSSIVAAIRMHLGAAREPKRLARPLLDRRGESSLVTCSPSVPHSL